MADLSRRVVVECSGITHCALRTVRVAVCLHNAIIFPYCRGQIQLSAGRVYPAPVSRVYVCVRSPRSRRGENAVPSKWVRISFFFFRLRRLVYVSRKEIGESDRKRSKLPFKIGRFDQIKTNGCWCHQRFQLKDGSINVGTADGFRGKNERRVGLPASHL